MTDGKPDRIVADYVRFHASAGPERLACLDLATGERLTYAQLDRRASQCVREFRERCGVEPGDRVVVLAKNSAHQLIMYLACVRLGAMFVPLNWRLAPAELRRLVEDSEPRVLFHTEEFAPAAREAANGTPILTLDDIAAGDGDAAPIPASAADPDAPTTILYTSGTSGRPKGVLITERNAFFTAFNFAMLGHVTPSSVMLCDAPMFHVICLLASIRSVLMCGGAVLLSPGFDPAVTLKRIADPALAVTHYFCVPQMAQRLREVPDFDPAKLGRLTALFTGGAPNPPSNVQRWLADGIRMVDGYGMTEAGTILGMPLDAALLARKAGAAGLAAPTLELRLVDADGQDVESGQVGEIWIRGPNVTPGYWRRPEETAAAFVDGWFRTGDLARRDADKFVTIVGRSKDMYISGGENVYPAEVETCLAKHPLVAEVAVVGTPDAKWGEIGVAYVVPASTSPIDETPLRDHAARHLARYKLPQRYVFVESLPRTTTGKVLKNQLRERLMESK